MITTPTLFLLGAGASHPYGFPLGSELRHLICESEHEGNSLAQAVRQGRSFNQTDIRDLAMNFRGSNINSIDAYLARHSQFVDVGKQLIAAAICEKESPIKFRTCDSDHWYRLLWNEMLNDVLEGARLRHNKVRFISFNYDRSLEYFFHHSTKHTFRVDDVTAFDYWSHLKILHVYGSVGDIYSSDPARLRQVRPYGDRNFAHSVAGASSGINIIPDSRDDAEAFVTARKWFDWAERVFVLGFGFDPRNCQRLNLASVLRSRQSDGKPLPFITASVLGLEDPEIGGAKELLLGSDGIWHPFKEPNTMTLRKGGFPAIKKRGEIGGK